MPMVWYVGLSALFISILIILSFLIQESTYVSKRELASPYECGFEQCSESRVPFSMRFFMLALIFLIFDLEILFLMLSPLFILSTSLVVKALLFTFCIILILGLFLEWKEGGLDWISS